MSRLFGSLLLIFFVVLLTIELALGMISFDTFTICIFLSLIYYQFLESDARRVPKQAQRFANICSELKGILEKEQKIIQQDKNKSA